MNLKVGLIDTETGQNEWAASCYLILIYESFVSACPYVWSFLMELSYLRSSDGSLQASLPRHPLDNALY